MHIRLLIIYEFFLFNLLDGGIRCIPQAWFRIVFSLTAEICWTRSTDLPPWSKKVAYCHTLLLKWMFLMFSHGIIETGLRPARLICSTLMFSHMPRCLTCCSFWFTPGRPPTFTEFTTKEANTFNSLSSRSLNWFWVALLLKWELAMLGWGDVQTQLWLLPGL